jgi:hypothetical protein
MTLAVEHDVESGQRSAVIEARAGAKQRRATADGQRLREWALERHV